MNRTLTQSNVTHWFPWDYFLIAFGFSWLCWFPPIMETMGILQLPVPAQGFLALGIFGPLVSAIWVTVKRKGWWAVRALFLRALDFRLSLIWWPVLLIIPLAIPATSLWLFGALGGEAGELQGMSNPWMILPTLLFMMVLGGGQEELGWRGYALDILQKPWSAFKASFILGLIWGVWHLPTFFISSTAQYTMDFLIFLAISPAMSILMTWVYNSTGKLFAVVFLHGTINTGISLFPPVRMVPNADQRVLIILCVLYWTWALIVVAAFGTRHLAHGTYQTSEHPLV